MDKKLSCHQFLFGYDGGHKLLAGSRELEEHEKSRLLIYSDVIQDRTEEANEYLTGIPLPSTDCYALMKSWMAYELPRPGCVWTHALILDSTQVEELELYKPPRSWFKRPKNIEDFSAYKYKTEYAHISKSEIHQHYHKTLSLLVKAVYSANSKGYFPSSPEADLLLFYLWMHQWPYLRKNFSFRTTGFSKTRSTAELEINLRLVKDIHFDLINKKPQNWEEIIAIDILSNKGTGFRSFTKEIREQLSDDKNTMRFLAQLYSHIKNTNNNSSDWPNLLDQIKEAIPGVQGENIRSILLDDRAMKNFDLRAPNTYQLLNIAFDEFDTDVNSASKSTYEERNGDSDQDIMLEKFITYENRLSKDLISKAISYFGDDILRIDLRPISEHSKNEIRDTTLSSLDLQSIKTANPVVLDNLVLLVTKHLLLDNLMQLLLQRYDRHRIEQLEKRFSSHVIKSVKNFIELNPIDSANLKHVIDTLQIFPASAVHDQLFDQIKEPYLLYAVIKATKADVTTALRHPSRQWSKLLKNLNRGSFSEKKWLSIQSFLLAIALKSPEPGCELIFEKCFVDVHDAWANGKLSPDSKSLLRSVMPYAPIFTWDWCWVLTRNVSKAYIIGDLNTKRLSLLKGDNVSRNALMTNKNDA